MFGLNAKVGVPLAPVGFTLGQAKVVIDDIYGHRETLCPVIAAQPAVFSAAKRIMKRFLKKLGFFAGLAAFAAYIGQMNPHLHAEQVTGVIGAITSAVATSWKVEIGTATHNHTVTTGDTFKTALYTSSATLGASTATYSGTNEVANGNGYTTGGVTCANVTPTSSGTTSIWDLADATWTGSSFTANGSLTYNSSKSNKAWFSIAFGSDQTVTSGTFTIQWPTADASNAIVRIA